MKTSLLALDLEPSVISHGSLSRGGVTFTDQEELSDYVPSHPLGVKPLGNRYTATSNARTATGNFQMLPDEILFILLEYLDSKSLRCLGYTCKAFYAFCYLDDLWKALFIE
jgi:F-box-like